MVEAGSALWVHRAHPALHQGHQSRGPGLHPGSCWRSLRSRPHTQPLGSLCQCSITCTAQKCSRFKYSSLYFSLWILRLALSTIVRSLSVTLTLPHQIYTCWWDPPEPSLLQAERAQLPASLIGENLQALHHLCGPLLDTPALQTQLHQCWIDGKDQLSWPAGNALPHAAQGTVGLLAVRMQYWVTFNLVSTGAHRSFFCHGTFQMFGPQRILGHRVFPAHCRILHFSLNIDNKHGKESVIGNVYDTDYSAVLSMFHKEKLMIIHFVCKIFVWDIVLSQKMEVGLHRMLPMQKTKQPCFFVVLAVWDVWEVLMDTWSLPV